jgi:hypothetical protein
MSATVFNVLQKQLDESTLCPICQAAMYWVEAEQYEQDLTYHHCMHCQHYIFSDSKHNCHCENCLAKRKKLVRETRLQEQRKFKQKEVQDVELGHLHFVEKLFLLAILNHTVAEHTQHQEFIDWDQIKYEPISPNYYFQNNLIKQLVKKNILIAKDYTSDAAHYYINVRLDGYSEPSLFSIRQQLHHWFYENLSQGIPFKQADEVKDALYLLLYQEIVQFMQFYCKTWQIQIAGNQNFQTFCYRLMDHLAIGQIYYMLQNALEYLYKQKALQPRNENFINTNLVKKTLEQYRERALNEKWETSTLPRPPQLYLSRMSQILFFDFLGYDEKIFVQPIWRAWKKIQPRLTFYSQKRCMYCGSNELAVEYDALDHVSLSCRNCKHQDHYFTQ